MGLNQRFQEEVIAMKITNIKWDTDGDMKILKSLPKEIDITDEFDVNDYEDDEDKLLDDISDWLSDTYGYCHFGFEIER
jgi:hypothetical protein